MERDNGRTWWTSQHQLLVLVSFERTFLSETCTPSPSKQLADDLPAKWKAWLEMWTLMTNLKPLVEHFQLLPREFCIFHRCPQYWSLAWFYKRLTHFKSSCVPHFVYSLIGNESKCLIRLFNEIWDSHWCTFLSRKYWVATVHVAVAFTPYLHVLFIKHFFLLSHLFANTERINSYVTYLSIT